MKLLDDFCIEPHIQKMINDLTELCPSEEDEWEDEDDDEFSTPDP